MFCLVEREKHAQLISESLRETLRGVLDVTFDASCECDETGRILCSSNHLQEMLLGQSAGKLLDLGLTQLAANAMEGQRIDTFLKQFQK